MCVCVCACVRVFGKCFMKMMDELMLIVSDVLIYCFLLQTINASLFIFVMVLVFTQLSLISVAFREQ